MTPDEYAAEAMLHAGMAESLAAQAEQVDDERNADLFDAWAEWHRLRHDYLTVLGAISAHRDAAYEAMDPTGPPTFWQGDLTLWDIVDADDEWRESLLSGDDSEVVYDEPDMMVPPPEWPGWN
jgi:hypothetical protein